MVWQLTSRGALQGNNIAFSLGAPSDSVASILMLVRGRLLTRTPTTNSVIKTHVDKVRSLKSEMLEIYFLLKGEFYEQRPMSSCIFSTVLLDAVF